MRNDREVKWVAKLCVRKDKSKTVIRWGCIDDWVGQEKRLQGSVEWKIKLHGRTHQPI